MKITEQEFLQIVTFVKNNYGIDLSKKRVLVAGRLEHYLTSNGYSNYAEFMYKVERDRSGKEAKALVNYLTTNHTYFLRESEHFKYMKEIMMPWIVEREKNTRDVRIWSAAASTGEEAYTVSMLLQDFFRLQPGEWDTTILATDISTRALEHAQKGVYLKEQLTPLPQHWIKSYFLKYSEEEFQVKPEIRGKVLFRSFNLMQPFPFKRKFHIVFLRNVMIYFDEETKHALLNKIYDAIEPGGCLFIGMTEALEKTDVKFSYIQPSIYRKPYNAFSV